VYGPIKEDEQLGNERLEGNWYSFKFSGEYYEVTEDDIEDRYEAKIEGSYW